MLADVTNKARGARGFVLADGATHLLEPGRSARLDLADHPLHRAWAEAGEVVMALVESPPAFPASEKLGRRRRSA